MENGYMSTRVCVTGGSGYVGSWLVKMLLEKGYTVHATLRNLGDTSKVDLLKSFPDADSRLVLFQADIYNPSEFEPAIKGCEYVFHVATPMLHNAQSSQYKDTPEAAVASVRIIADSCIRSQTVKRLIYTASFMASSPLTEDGVSFKSCMDESCWTPLDHIPALHASDITPGYTKSKILAEKEALKYNEYENGKLEVVTLPCGLVAGETLLPYVPTSVEVLLSLLTGNLSPLNVLKLLQKVWGAIFLVHVEDVCRAHIFCMENPSMKGRFLCAAYNPTIREIAVYFQEKFPEYQIPKEFLEGPIKGVGWDSAKLKKMGFEYTYDEGKILADSVACGRRLGALAKVNNSI
ncbi:putative anthocyanidin reductase [Juglans microcarpa x Juglans regia]|uniref:putative anthocyanidin reductase n=1 Tax=Juglans microcarpa x Juglans regia TaxID=2249226 RepID=UPI001B7F04A4|nr:putative anthocyanidin reductase [Juglans microcarpa x Juglans regia]